MAPGSRAPGPVPKEALGFFASKGIKPGFSYQDVWAEEHKVAFTVAKIMERDILTTVHDSLITAIQEGVPFEQWRREMEPLFDRSGWSAYNKSKRQKQYRLKVIYQTNLRMSRARGQWERVQRTKKAVPYLVYDLGPSQRHRPEHVEWSGLVLPVDDPFWDDAMPPNGYGCKCYVTQITKYKMEKLGGVSESPPRVERPWKNPATGRTEMVRVGVQPGFNHNPGKKVDREKSLAQQDRESKATLRDAQRRAKEAVEK